MIMIISERCTIQCPIRLFQVKIQPIGKKWRCFLSGLNEYLMEIDGLNENSSSEFLAATSSHFAHHQFYLIFNSMHHGIWCGWNAERARASHTKKDSEPTELERRTVKHAMQLNRFFFCVRLFVANWNAYSRSKISYAWRINWCMIAVVWMRAHFQKK